MTGQMEIDIVVSVIIPVYNTEKYLQECLESVCKQKYSSYEVILIDDGSTDKSGSICDHYAFEYEFVKVVHTKNQGVSVARNIGINLAKGKYITFIDSDDWVDNDYLSILLKHMTPGGIAMCLVDEKSEEKEKDVHVLNSNQLDQDICKLNPEEAQLAIIKGSILKGYVCSKMFDMELISKENILFTQDLVLREDFLFCIQYLYKAKGEILLLKKEAYHYRIYPESSYRRINKGTECDERILSESRALEKSWEYLISSPQIVYAWKTQLIAAMMISLRRMILRQHRTNSAKNVCLVAIDKKHSPPLIFLRRGKPN